MFNLFYKFRKIYISCIFFGGYSCKTIHQYGEKIHLNKYRTVKIKTKMEHELEYFSNYFHSISSKAYME